MSILKTEAFVIKSFKYGETSRIVTLFTRDNGKISAIVKGIRGSKSRLSGTLETMNYVNVILYHKVNRELQLITNAEYISSFKSMLLDLDKLESGYRIIDILNKSVIENESNESLFDLLIKVYGGIDKCSGNSLCYALYFQMELAKILGLNPGIEELLKEKETFFDKNEFYLNESSIEHLRLMTENTFEDLDKIDIEKEFLMRLMGSYERYLSAHTHGYKFYNTAKVFQELNPRS